MMTFSLWKQLKKKLKRKRRPLWSMCAATAVLMAVIILLATAEHTMAMHSANGRSTSHLEPAHDKSMLQKLEQTEQTLLVKLHRVFVCGEEEQLLGELSPKQVINMLTQYPDWTAILNQDDRSVLLEQHINDLSDYCKSNAYFGVDREGNFSLFDGLPVKDKVMRTFFQIDIQYMESNLPQERVDQLAKGIRVNDIDEYNSVLSTFSDFAKERNEEGREGTERY